ncbi:MAG: potassium channel protein [Cytophagales bacterium]|nr:potassium channel protein [Cytophagales bacterium]
MEAKIERKGRGRFSRIPQRLEKLVGAIILLVLSIVIGTSGFVLVEGYSLREAFYMTVMTISTVGFGEVRPLSSSGQVFTSFYILFNLSIFAYFLSVVSTYLFEGELREIFDGYMSGRSISKLENHVIVCGYGRNGFRACEELRKDGVDFVVIDSSEEVFNKRYDDETNTFYLIGDASDEKLLERANVAKAKALIASMPDDAVNVFVTLTAKELNPDIKIVARASRASSEQKLLRAGAEHVVMPDVMGGQHMATLVQKPHVIAFMDMINGVDETVELQLEEFTYEELADEYQGKSFADMQIRTHLGVSVLGYRKGGKEFVLHPTSGTVLQPDDILILLGVPEQLTKFRENYLKK